MALFEDDDPPARPGNSPEYTVSELSGAVKRVIEGEFGLIRVRGEVGRVSRPASGHLYFDLKDDRNVIAAIAWPPPASAP
jgi:exodeoxyribonuclease VII large subunit